MKKYYKISFQKAFNTKNMPYLLDIIFIYKFHILCLINCKKNKYIIIVIIAKQKLVRYIIIVFLFNPKFLFLYFEVLIIKFCYLILDNIFIN